MPNLHDPAILAVLLLISIVLIIIGSGARVIGAFLLGFVVGVFFERGLDLNQVVDLIRNAIPPR